MAHQGSSQRAALDGGWACFGLALLARLAVVAWAGSRIPPTADASYYQRIAERIAEGHGYTWLWPDGAVTYAAHYPVGYPGLLAPLFYAFGNAPAVGMIANAVLGAFAALAVHRALAGHGRAATVAGVLVALHPGLLAYTPALMTEGVTAALLAMAAWAAVAARRRGLRGLVTLGIVLGLAAMVRPQSIVLAPLFGFAAAPPRWTARARSVVFVSALAMLVCLPWTLRNCARMGRCAFVSVNGGWNLLIGTDARGKGGWAPLEVPRECREVFDEAGKDRCFREAAKRIIADNPRGWLSLAPGKLRATFDYCGAGGWYLHQSNPTAFGDRAKLSLGTIETAYERALLALAFVGLLPHRRQTRAGAWAMRCLALLGIALSVSPWGWLAHITLMTALALSLVQKRWRPVWAATFATLASLALVHAAFFGGGRYQLPALPLLTALGAIGITRFASLGSSYLRSRHGNKPSRSSANTTSHTGSPTTLE
jgi:hypothetical protein